MPLTLLSADHHSVTLDDLERLSVGVDSLPTLLADHPAVDGAVVLATCNRVELYLEAADPDAALDAARAALASTSGVDPLEIDDLTGRTDGHDAVRHLFEVASGLDAMVVGEREIVGQVRRALEDARAAGATTPALEDALQRASRASRRIAVDTDLAAAGRSVVAVALDLAGTVRARPACPRDDEAWTPESGELPRSSWSGARALVVGTGAYAGATVAALRRRECTTIAVWSASGRARGFADAEHVRAAGDLAEELALADVVVACRGTGTPVVDADAMSSALAARRAAGTTEPLVVVDLALRHDVSAEAAALPGVVVVDLDTVKAHAPAATEGQVRHAQEVLAEEVRVVVETRAERAMDDVVVAVRDRVGSALEDELTRLPMAGTVPADQAAQALRRLAARLAHPPTVAARAAGRDGRGEEFVRALELVTGIAVADETAGAGAGQGRPPARRTAK
ncbi:glutamyl-tRNA reductase [Georgenia sp. Z1491]|uniref:glutamyl-tRNA reductase n=1 Tax=Georgenia sp. Z1491 TaxID=3416707 RepID=UPI003CEC7E0E